MSKGVITLTFNFADGSTVTTPEIDIPQGAQGPQGDPGPQGPQGPQGPKGPKGEQGESFNPMGHWIGDNEYHPFDYVNYGGSSYLCTATIIDGTDAPPIDTAHWQLVAEKGDAGEAPAGTVTQSTVIERPESLPAATADSPDFVEVGGVLYRKKAVEGGSLLGTWVFKSTVSTSSALMLREYSINFVSNGETYSILSQGYDARAEEHTVKYDSTIAYFYAVSGGGGWKNSAYKTIQITDISALTNEAEFTSWLTENATKQGGGASVSYSYVALADA